LSAWLGKMSVCPYECCRRGSKAKHTTESTDSTHVDLTVQTPLKPSNETTEQTATRLRQRLEGMRQRTESEDELQRQTMLACSQQHQHRMADMQTNHADEMAKMEKRNGDATTACESAMQEMNIRARRQEGRITAEHNTSMAAMRRANDCAKTQRNERMNVRQLETQQRLKHMAQQIDAQCSDLKQRQRDEMVLHSKRMKMLSFSHAEAAQDVRNHNAENIAAQRQCNRDKKLTQRNRVAAANEQHQKSLAEQKLSHGRQIDTMREASVAGTAHHVVKMGRLHDKNAFKTDDLNHITLNFVALEDRCKQSDERCAEQKRTLAANAQTKQQCHKRRELLLAQSKVLHAAAATLEKHNDESAKLKATAKRTTFDSEMEEVRSVQNTIKCACNGAEVFGKEMERVAEELCKFNVQMSG